MKRISFIKSLWVGLLMSFVDPDRVRINNGSAPRRARINTGGAGSVTINAEAPAVPTLDTPLLTANAVSSTQINLSWTEVENATNYVLERSTDASTWTEIYSGTDTGFNNTSLTGSTQYYYKVTAEADGYTSATSSISDDTTPPADVDSPVILRLTTSTDGTKINILFDRDMDSSTGMHAQFTWKQNLVSRTITAAATVNDRTVQLTTSHTIAAGEEVLLTYSPGTVQSDESGAMQAIVDAYVLNCRTASDIPFFDNWDMIVDARDESKFTLSGSNITLFDDAAATGRWFKVQSTAYAVHSSDAIVVTNGTTNEYTTEYEVRKPISGRFTFAVMFKTPASGDSSATNSLYFLRHSVKGDLINSNYNATPARRNMRVFTTADYYSTGLVQSTIENDNDWHYVVATYNGSTYKMWCDGTYVSRTMTINTHEMFNRILQANVSRCSHSIKLEMMGEYLSDSDVGTLNTFFAGL